MRWAPLTSMVMAFPALFQVQVAGGSSTKLPIEQEARDFMIGYAHDLRSGRRLAIANRYDRRGAFRVGEGEKVFETPEMITAAYLTQWSPPKTFEWRNLSYEVLSSDAVVVVGLFDWGVGDGRKVAFSYTGLLVRQDGTLWIRLEDESLDRKPAVVSTTVS